jgi:hypothetical protein
VDQCRAAPHGAVVFLGPVPSSCSKPL